MLLSDLSVEVRDSSLKRIGQLDEVDLVGFKAVGRFNDVGYWEVSLSASSRLCEILRTPGSGLVVSVYGKTFLSGPTSTVIHNRNIDDVEGSYKISGVDDTILLKDRLAYPLPSSASLDEQTVDSDDRSGLAEDVIKAYVEANLGSLAPTPRRVAELVIEPSWKRGSEVSASARFETVYEVISKLASLSNLGFDIRQIDSQLVFEVFEPRAKYSGVRFSLDNGNLSKSDYSFGVPKSTAVIVGGLGEGADRYLLERTSGRSLSAQETWKRRIEVFEDQRSEAEIEKLEQAGDEILARDGDTVVSLSISPSDDLALALGRDWNLGDLVSCEVGDVEVFSVISEVGISVESDGIRVGATVGEPNGFDYESQLLSRQSGQASRISRLERI